VENPPSTAGFYPRAKPTPGKPSLKIKEKLHDLPCLNRCSRFHVHVQAFPDSLIRTGNFLENLLLASRSTTSRFRSRKADAASTFRRRRSSRAAHRTWREKKVYLVLYLEKYAGCGFIFHERTRFLANEATVVACSRRYFLP